MTDVILNNLPLWTSAVKNKSTAGRGSRSKLELTGIKKLRELILELAVRGQLVPQDQRDEPASELVKRIAAEKAELIKAGKLKKQKPLPEITEEEKPFALPQGWEWVRLDSFCDVRDGTHDTPRYQSDGFPLITSKNISSGILDFNDVKFISETDHNLISERSAVDNGDILFAMIGTIGNPVIVNTDKKFSIKNVALFKPTASLKSKMNFLKLALEAKSKMLNDFAAGGVQKFVSLGMLRSTVIAAPPVSEQQRIVAKVDELMALCDQLEQQTENHTGAHQQLVETLLATLTNIESSDELNANWARLAAHFDLLFSGPMGSWAVDRLKDTILQLAVQGKLVPQNPLDEPASALLARIEAEKAELIKQGKLKKQKPLPPISDDEKPFELPQCWEWARLGFAIKLASGKGFKQSEYSTEGVRLLQIANVGIGTSKWEVLNYLPTTYWDLYPDLQLSVGDILIALNRPLLNYRMKICILEEDDVPSILYQRVGKLSFYFDGVSKRYFFFLLQSPFFKDWLDESLQGSDQPFINQTQLEMLAIPFPPLEEQTRIVEKVDQLFALCDQLKAALDAACDTQLQLSSAVVEQSLALH